ncbi:hypothetical protein JP0101_14930 [Helicobacter pylori]|nr:hypothetical protein JP0101_14930 [Helicobacter pylori]
MLRMGEMVLPIDSAIEFYKPDQKPLDQKLSDQKPQKLSDQKPQKLSDQKPLDQKFSEQKLSDQKPLDQKLSDQKPQTPPKETA